MKKSEPSKPKARKGKGAMGIKPDEMKVTQVFRTSEKRAVSDKKGSPKAQRTAARLAAVQVLYQMRLNNQDAKPALREFVDKRIGFKLDDQVLVPADKELLNKIVLGLQDRWSDVDGIVSGALAAGRRGEVEPLLDCILKAGCFELLSHGDVDAGVIINDYLNVTTAFYEGSEPKLVNAVLDKVAKTVRG